MKSLLRIFPLALALILFAACDSDPNVVDTPVDLEVQMATDIPADPIVGIVGGRPVGAGVITYFSLRTGQVVADSASIDWDLAFQATTIFVNGGTSGPGQGGAMMMEAAFEEVTEAPATGYAMDSPDGMAVPSGSGNGWYNYNPAVQLVSPIPGRVIVVRTADGRFGKVRILSYYRGAPAEPTSESESRYYTFEYVFQPDGTRVF